MPDTHQQQRAHAASAASAASASAFSRQRQMSVASMVSAATVDGAPQVCRRACLMRRSHLYAY